MKRHVISETALSPVYLNPCSYPFFLLVVLTCGLFFLYFINYIPYPHNFFDSKRVVEVGILWFTLSLLLCSSRARRQLAVVYCGMTPWRRRALGLFFLLGSLSALHAAKPLAGMNEVTLFAALSLFSLLISATRLNQALSADAWFIFGVFLICFVYTLFYFLIDPTYAHSVFPGFVNIRFFAEFQLWTMPIVLLPLCRSIREKKIISSAFFLLFNSLWVYFLFLGNSRGEVFSFLIACLIVGILFRKRAWLFNVCLFSAVGLEQLFVLWSHRTTGSILPTFERTAPIFHSLKNIGERLALWKKAILLWWHHPLLGIGPGHFALTPDYALPYAAPHNSLLQILTEWGVIAFLLMLCLSVGAFRKWIQWAKHNGTNFSGDVFVALSTALFAGMLFSMVSNVIVTPLSQLMMALVMGWIYGAYRAAHKQPAAIQLPSLFFPILAFCLIILSGVLLNIPSAQKTNQFLMQHQGGALGKPSPRFWLQGWL